MEEKASVDKEIISAPAYIIPDDFGKVNGERKGCEFMPLYGLTKSAHEDFLKEKHNNFTLYDTTGGTTKLDRIGGYDTFKECEKAAREMKERYPERGFTAYEENGSVAMVWPPRNTFSNLV